MARTLILLDLVNLFDKSNNSLIYFSEGTRIGFLSFLDLLFHLTDNLLGVLEVIEV